MQTHEHQEDPQIQTKLCCDCQQHQPTDLFAVNKVKADGLQRYCVQCEGVRKRLYAKIIASNPAAIFE